MALETGTYISDLVVTNPTATDPKSAGDDHFRLIKSTVKTTFPNITGAVTPTHTELNYVDGVTSAIQTQIDTKAPTASPTFTGTPAAPTAAAGTNTTQLATTAFVATSFAPLASPALTGTPTAPTAAAGTSTTQIATTAFVAATAFSSSLPAISVGVTDYFVTNDGSAGSWGNLLKTGTIRFADSTDTTKRLALDLSAVSASTTVTASVPAGTTSIVLRTLPDFLLMSQGII